jgi:hypothetical protein
MSLKEIRLAEKSVALQKEVITELKAIVKDIERCERTITELKSELSLINSKYSGPRNTRQDIDYLTSLLNCAKKKLAWEKNLASLQKRTPQVLENMTNLLNDPKNPPADPMRMEMLQALQGVQNAMERLQNVQPT